MITPCGVSHTWRMRSLTASGLATGRAPPSDQAYYRADGLNGTLLSRERLAAAAARRVLALRAHDVQPHRGRLVIDGHHVGFRIETGPSLSRSERLAEGGGRSAAGVLNRVESRGPHGVRSRLDAGPLFRAA